MKETIRNIRKVYQYGKEYKKNLIVMIFAVFPSRLTEPSRPEIKEILATYGMTKYDDFELLKRSGAKLPTDNYEFVI